ncbi:SAM-dependent methyltransferase [Nonomuraea phyllanthi]|uniref:SAM-dependent methyltransferase n=1 Tax=Nonomuraea phyllanthi TaxID=2219224 RepID=A0A5C4WHS6_9ACTN|nr:O-methyltransferase [Nonomuraea phyllanthi]KAB8193662.1 SAM-dependent methyltransferase [Nonomuraea phyllanthi]
MKAYLLDPAVARYVFDHSTPPDALLEKLAEETAEATGDAAGMQISPDQGTFLTMITQLVAPQVVVEVGTFTGYSSVCIARGLSGGRLYCFDVSEEWTSVARRYWGEAGVADRVTLTLGPALETLAGFDQPVDLAFLDADKGNYPGYYELIMERLRPGGLIVADNTLRRGYVADPAHEEETTVQIRQFNDLVREDPRVTVLMLPVADGMTLIRKN